MENKKLLIIVAVVILCSGAYWFINTQNNNYKTPETELEELSYSLGINFASMMKSQGIDSIDVNSVAKAFTDFFSENDLDISEEEGMEIIKTFFTNLEAKRNAEIGAYTTDHLTDTTKEGVITTESGLQYKILQKGNGIQASKGDMLTVHYTGMLVNGNIFQSSIGNQPLKFSLGEGQVLPGWDEAFQLMSIGDKWKLIIPGNLAYGETGQPRAGIEPNTTLIFYVELLAIN